jgi:broad specificity phosphatase PhoE
VVVGIGRPPVRYHRYINTNGISKGGSIVHLVRHLPTDGTPRPGTWLDQRGFAAWLAQEGERGIIADARPSARLVGLVGASRHLLVSPLARAQATAAAVVDRLAADARPPVVTVDDLVEAPLPPVPLPRVRLPADAWDVVARVAWLLGYSGPVEPRRDAVGRARRVAGRLGELAPSGTVTVIAHGFTNVLVGRELRRLGWQGPRLPDHHNGAATTYRYGDATI